MTEIANIIRITIVCEGIKEVEKFRTQIAEFLEFNGIRVLEETSDGKIDRGIYFVKKQPIK